MKYWAHNLNEVKALIKEAIKRGESDEYNGSQWYKHDSNDSICRVFCSDIMAHFEYFETVNDVLKFKVDHEDV